MSKIEDAKKILKEVGMPEQQQTDIAAYSLLTLADIGPKGKWSTAKTNGLEYTMYFSLAVIIMERSTRRIHGKQFGKMHAPIQGSSID